MKTVDISCDGCGRDLTTTGNMVDYRLLLTSENIAPSGPTATAMMVYPAIMQPAHFCGLHCLRGWLAKEPK